MDEMIDKVHKSPTIYSWGRSDLYCLFYKDNKDNCDTIDGVYTYRS